MSLNYTYMDAIGIGFPTVGCHIVGDATVYENIVWDSGDSIPSKSTLDTWIFNYTQNQMWELIKNERDRRKTFGGYKVNVSGTDYWFHSDDISRIQQLGLVMLGTNLPSNVMWKTMSGDFVLMTPTLAQQIFQAAIVSDMAIFTIAEQKRVQMLQSATPGNFDYLSGWPKSYGE